MAQPKSDGVMTPISYATQAQASTGYGWTVGAKPAYSIQSAGPEAWFGPWQPLAPMAPLGTGGRAFDYQTGQNLNYIPRGDGRPRFEELRALVDNLAILGTVVEKRKDQIAGWDWEIVPKLAGKDRRGKAVEDSSTDNRIDAVRDLLRRPDRRYSFHTWLRKLLDDMLVIDAACIYPRLTRKGDLYSLDCVDGSTIKVLIGEDGRIPLPEDGPAYQQILHGVPAADFNLEELMYLPRNLRSNHLYGKSPVEVVLMTINIALRRDVMALQYYDAGTLPDSFGTLPKEWTVDQIKSFQDYFDSLMRGNFVARRGIKFMPADFKMQEVRQPPLKDMYDEWLLRVIYAAFNVSPSGMVQDQNRATSQTLQVQASHEGIGPMKAWVKELFDHIIQELMDFDDLEFRWQGEDEIDPLEQAQALQILVSAGIKTEDEARTELGLAAMTSAQVAAQQAKAQAKMPAAQQVNADEGQPSATSTGSAKEPVEGGDAASIKAMVAALMVKMDALAANGLAHGQSAPLAAISPPQVGRDAQKAASGPGSATLYVSRPLINPDDLIAWAKAEGFETTLPADDLHVTIAFSREPFEHGDLVADDESLGVAGGKRSIEKFGDAVVLTFTSSVLQRRWQEIRDAGASWDHDAYQPHITITYDSGDLDLARVKPYGGQLWFGAEEFAPVNENWEDDIEEKAAAAEVGKRAATPFRKLPILSHDRPDLAALQTSMQALWTRALGRMGHAAKRGFLATAEARKLAKAEPSNPSEERPRRDDDTDNALTERDIADVIESLDLSLDAAEQADLEAQLRDAAQSSITRAYAQVGLGIDDAGDALTAPDADTLGDTIFEQLNETALDWAKDHAGELVTQIDQTTESAVRDAIVSGIDDNLSTAEIADALAALGVFDEDRADLIANTEIAFANSYGALEGYKQASKDYGVETKKIWMIANTGDVCDDCQDNADQGPIDLDEAFPSGDDAPPGHPNCRCAIAAVVYGGNEQDQSDEDDNDETTKAAPSRFTCN